MRKLDDNSTRRIRLCLWTLFVTYELFYLLLSTMTTNHQSESIHRNKVRMQRFEQRQQEQEEVLLDETKADVIISSNRENHDANNFLFWNETKYSFNLDLATIEEWDQRYVPEPGYPRKTVVEDFDTRAVQLEVAKHDDQILRGMKFMNQFLRQRYPQQVSSSSSSSSYYSSTPTDHPPRLCIVICICNRKIPYIYALLQSLIEEKIETEEEGIDSSPLLLSFAQIHLLNTEKRPEAQILHPNTPYNQSYTDYFHQTFSHLPFIHTLHDGTQYDASLMDILSQQQDKRLPTFHETTISDQLIALRICINSNSSWCLVMEEDAIASTNFASSLLEDVLNPLEKKRPSISIISLYSYYNLVFKGDLRLNDPSYSKFFYDEDVTKGYRKVINNYNKNITETSSEKTYTQSSYRRKRYSIQRKEYKYGAVANLYTFESARKLSVYLEEIIVDNPEHNADEYINAPENFPLAVGCRRKQVEPSLVNHIGFYSERMSDVTSRGMFSQLNTDVRFVYDIVG